MAKKSEGNTADAPDKGKSVYLIWGSDEFLVSRQARDLVHQLCPPEQQALGLEIVEGRVDTKEPALIALRGCRAALETVGFFGAAKTIWLREAEFFHDNRVGRLADVKAEVVRLAELIKGGLMSGQRLVVSAGKVDRRSSFYKACQAVADVREFSVPEKAGERERYGREIVQLFLREHGLRASHQAVEDLLGKVGVQSRQLFQEIEKLRSYLGDRNEVAEEDVHLIVSPSREAAGWDLADAFGERNLKKTMEVLRQLLFQNEKAFVLIMGLQTRVRELLLFRTSLDQRWLRLSGQKPWFKAEWNGAGDAEVLFDDVPDTLHPAKMNPWRAGRLAAQAAVYTRIELARAQQVLLDAHESMLRTGVPHELLLEVALVKIIGKDQHAS